ncbi:hypothetical protein ACFYW8_00425 [Streptomyces sp. NPDC002742]|uniref:Rv1733c family protein n=1 Tax=Streptomyces sp. NPDC002742 TaxID=3364663 RepID=UPI00369AB6C5
MARTASGKGTVVRMWRWRSNPLRRHSDVIEAWIVLVTWTLAVVFGLLAGVVAARAVGTGLSAQAARAHAVPAVLTVDAPSPPAAVGGSGGERVWAAVRWTTSDGTVHAGKAKVLPGAPAGTRVTVWTDRTDHVVPAPMTGTQATLEAALAGALVASSAGAAVWAAGRVARTRLDRRRMAEWDAEWQQVGPQWGNLSGGRG